MYLRRFIRILLVTVSVLHSEVVYSDEWKIVESLAEEHPYVVALLNSTTDYVCTGCIIDSRTILTSGYCISPDPTFVAVGLAVLSKRRNHLHNVTYTLVHTEYTYVMNSTEPSMTQIHSNIGLVFVARPLLEHFMPPATIGSYFAQELVEVELTSVGYGKRYAEYDVYVLQYQCYDQAPCINPRWYYCICGTEITSVAPTHGKDFGNGAPVLFGSDVVCLSATSTGAPILKSAGVKYNIFTVIGAYIPWIEKTESYKILHPRVDEIDYPSKAEHINHDRILYTIITLNYLVVR